MPWSSLLQEVASAMLAVGSVKPSSSPPTLVPTAPLRPNASGSPPHTIEAPASQQASAEAASPAPPPEVVGPGNSRKERPLAEYIDSHRFQVSQVSSTKPPAPRAKVKQQLKELMLPGHRESDMFGWLYPLHVGMVLQSTSLLRVLRSKIIFLFVDMLPPPFSMSRCPGACPVSGRVQFRDHPSNGQANRHIVP